MKRWHLILDEYDITEDDFTLADLVRIDELAGQTWASVNPAQNPKTLLAWVRVALERQNIDPDRARRMAENLSSKQLSSAVQLVDESDDAGATDADAGAAASGSIPKAPASTPTAG
jgi:hypothetical protein